MARTGAARRAAMRYAVVPLGAPAAHAVPPDPLPAVRDLGVADGVARGRAHVRLPARALVGAPAGVEAQAGDDHEGVAGVGVDRDPLALAGLAPAHEAGRVERLVEHPGAVEGVGHRARAVVARVLPRAVPAAVLVRLGGDPVAGGDDRLDQRRRAGAARSASPSSPTMALPVGARPARPRARARLDRGAQHGASARLMRPSTRRCARAPTSARGGRCRGRTGRRRAVRKPRVRKSWRTRTSLPRIPILQRPRPKVRLAAAASATGTVAAPRAKKATASVRQRDNENPFLSSPTGLAVGLARKESRYAASLRRFAPGPEIPGPIWFPRSGPRLVPRARFGVMSLTDARHDSSMPRRDELKHATSALDAPFAVVDLDAFDPTPPTCCGAPAAPRSGSPRSPCAAAR